MTTPLPRSPVVLGVLVRAFQATQRDCDEGVCVLKGSTARLGFAGGATRRWCCSITALVHTLWADGVLALDDQGIDPRLLLFLLGAREAIRWNRIASATRLPARAHLRVAAIEFAARAALLLSSARAETLSALLSDPPAWADPVRRPEPVRLLVERLPGSPDPARIARASRISERSFRRWLRGEQRPSREGLDKLAGHLHRESVIADAMTTLRMLEWHYGLGALGDAVAVREGRELVLELAAVVTRAVACGTRNLHGNLDDLPNGARAAHAAGALFDVPLDVALEHAEKHGGSASWRADALAVACERAALPDLLEIRTPDQLAILLQRLPRKPARRVRR